MGLMTRGTNRTAIHTRWLSSVRACISSERRDSRQVRLSQNLNAPQGRRAKQVALWARH